MRQQRVTVNGAVVADPAYAVDRGDELGLDGRPLVEAPRRYFAFHKPRQLDIRGGASGSDPLFGYVPSEIPGLEAVGRMDARVSGLVLVSNDNWWNAAVATRRKLERAFEIRVSGTLGDAELSVIQNGMHLPCLGYIKPVSARILGVEAQQTLLRISVRGGKIRQLRRLFTSLRHEVTDLQQVQVGVVKIGALVPGQVRPLTRAEIRGLELL